MHNYFLKRYCKTKKNVVFYHKKQYKNAMKKRLCAKNAGNRETCHRLKASPRARIAFHFGVAAVKKVAADGQPPLQGL